MKANHEKWRLLLSKTEERIIQVSGTSIKSSKYEKLLGVHFDEKLNFDTHIENTCKKANRKLNAFKN